MEKKFFSGILSAGTVIGAVMTGGCIGAGVDTGLEIGTTHVNNFGPGPQAQQVRTRQPDPLPQTEQIILLGDQKDLLRLTFSASGVSADEKKLAEEIARQTVGSLAPEDAKVMTSGNGDIHLTVRPKLKLIDKDGDYHRVNCDVTFMLNAVNSSRTFAHKTLNLVSPKRVLGRDAAFSQFDATASKAAAEWCRAELKRIADRELGVAVLSIQLPTPPKGKARRPELDAANIKAVGDNLRKLPNLVSYEFAGSDSEKGVCKYRVAYFRSAYPSGIANAVSALLSASAQHK